MVLQELHDFVDIFCTVITTLATVLSLILKL